jgi:ABC-type dipeptide/oligopeptide/nickel transport system permease subunit
MKETVGWGKETERFPRLSGWLEFWRRFSRHKPAVAGLILIVAMFITGIFAPYLAPYSYTEQNLDAVEQWPSWKHPLGTDELGRDQLSRIIWGARTAVIVAPTATFISVTIGVVMGAIAGYFGGKVESLIMRITDVLFAFPGLLFAILITATIQPRIEKWLKGFEFLREFVRAGYAGVLVVIVALSFVGWPGMARLVRGQFLSLKEKEFVVGARAIGASPWRIIARHLLPNSLPPIIVSISMGMGGAILAEATLGFFGIGIRPPTASWGSMILDNYTFWRHPAGPILLWLPGLIVGSLILAFNFVGDGLNEAFRPER